MDVPSVIMKIEADAVVVEKSATNKILEINDKVPNWKAWVARLFTELRAARRVGIVRIADTPRPSSINKSVSVSGADLVLANKAS